MCRSLEKKKKKKNRSHTPLIAARVQWRSISLSGYDLATCKSKNLSKYQSIHVFIRTSCFNVGEKLAIRDIVWRLSNGKGRGASRQHGSPPSPVYAPGVGGVYSPEPCPVDPSPPLIVIKKDEQKKLGKSSKFLICKETRKLLKEHGVKYLFPIHDL